MLNELIDALIAADLATEGAVFKAEQPPDPPRALILRRYGGAILSQTMDGTVIEQPAVQFMFRAPTYDDAETWAQAVFAWCFGALGGAPHYLGLTPRGPVIDAGQDENQNAIVTLNVDVARESVVGGVAV